MKILQGDALTILKTLPDESVQCCVTSPPYYGLRDYGVDGQMGLEKTPQEFLSAMVSVFREVRRVLKKDGTCWCNMGDSYANSSNGSKNSGLAKLADKYAPRKNPRNQNRDDLGCVKRAARPLPDGFKSKDLMGMPWRLAFALQESGWYLRQDIIWSKPNPMPESVTDRFTKAHEYIFLLTKSRRYFFDAAAVKEPVSGGAHSRGSGNNPKASWNGSNFTTGKTGEHQLGRAQKVRPKQNESYARAMKDLVEKRTKRSVWHVAPQAYSGAHFATYPAELITPCILAGSRPGDIILDPFAGSGTTGEVSAIHGRDAILIELNPDYIPLIEERLGIFYSREVV